jgi:Mitochondrial K+-H+ exchange-related
MDVYLVPVGPSQHELYCEVPDEPHEAEDAEQPQGLFRRLRARFREMLAEAERDRLQARAVNTQGGWLMRAKARLMRWVAESIAEQRLLWHLRRQTEACLYYPDDLDETQAAAALRSSLVRDFDKHRFWLTIDALLFIASGLFMLVPGPNVLAYYFAFRVVGHYFSLQGARQGLNGVTWRYEKSAPLAELRRAIELAPDVRVRQVHEVAHRLQLEHLASFFERTAIPLSRAS